MSATFGLQNGAIKGTTRPASGSRFSKISLGLSALSFIDKGVGFTKLFTMTNSAVVNLLTFSTILEASFVYELFQQG